MEFTLSQQGTCFLLSIICGLFIAVLYDLFRIPRLLFGNKITTFVCDFLFLTSSGIISTVFSMAFSRGNTRYFTIIGELLGFMIYRLTIGRITVRVFRYIFAKITSFFNKNAEKIRKTGKKLLQVTGSVLYNIFKNKRHKSNNVSSVKGKVKDET